MNKFRNLIYAILGGILFSAAWPFAGGLTFLLFVAFVPLLYIEDYYLNKESAAQRSQGRRSGLKFFGLIYLAFFIWNAIATWWIYYSTLFGMIGAVVCNSFFMAMIFYLFHLTRKKAGNRQGYIALIVYWIAWEWWHMQWDLSWPWLTLGNGFANDYKWIQWYEYTGVFGGSFWVLAINILVFKLINIKAETFELPLIKSVFILLLIIVPIMYSFRIYNKYNEINDPINVVAVQPNVDPYNVKFDVSSEELLDKMLMQAKKQIDSTTDYLVFPETALTENIWENDIDSASSILYLKEFLKQYPRLKIITGASTYYAFSPNEPLSPTARKFKMQEGYYDAFNTALQIDSSGKVQIYHKSKLVVGVEKMPYPALFKPLEKFAIDLGGTSGSLGIQEARSCLNPNCTPQEGGARVASVICYESIYGEFVTGYVKLGADVIFIITNDGWWDNTAGHKQHLAYGRLRAIETRRSIARSANTGISCFINQKGDISQPTKWWEESVIMEKINKNYKITFYVKHGDYIARASLFTGIFLLLWTIVKSIISKNRQHVAGI